MQHHVYVAGRPALKESDVLEAVGIGNNSTLFIRASILGGAPRAPHTDRLVDGATNSTSFNWKTGEFLSEHPDSAHVYGSFLLTLP